MVIDLTTCTIMNLKTIAIHVTTVFSWEYKPIHQWVVSSSGGRVIRVISYTMSLCNEKNSAIYEYYG